MAGDASGLLRGDEAGDAPLPPPAPPAATALGAAMIASAASRPGHLLSSNSASTNESPCAVIRPRTRRHGETPRSCPCIRACDTSGTTPAAPSASRAAGSLSASSASSHTTSVTRSAVRISEASWSEPGTTVAAAALPPAAPAPPSAEAAEAAGPPPAAAADAAIAAGLSVGASPSQCRAAGTIPAFRNGLARVHGPVPFSMFASAHAAVAASDLLRAASRSTSGLMAPCAARMSRASCPSAAQLPRAHAEWSASSALGDPSSAMRKGDAACRTGSVCSCAPAAMLLQHHTASRRSSSVTSPTAANAAPAVPGAAARPAAAADPAITPAGEASVPTLDATR